MVGHMSANIGRIPLQAASVLRAAHQVADTGNTVSIAHCVKHHSHRSIARLRMTATCYADFCALSISERRSVVLTCSQIKGPWHPSLSVQMCPKDERGSLIARAGLDLLVAWRVDARTPVILAIMRTHSPVLMK